MVRVLSPSSIAFPALGTREPSRTRLKEDGIIKKRGGTEVFCVCSLFCFVLFLKTEHKEIAASVQEPNQVPTGLTHFYPESPCKAFKV